MSDTCKNCGAALTPNSKFCPECGSKQSPVKASGGQNSTNKIRIVALIIVIIALAGAILFSGVLKPEIPLETHDFEIFKMDVPVGSDFQVASSIPSFGNVGGFVILENRGEYSKEAYFVMISTIQGSTPPSEVSFDRTEGDITIYKDSQGRGAYYLTREVDGFIFDAGGKDEATLIKMMKSIEITDLDELSSKSNTSSLSTTADATPSQSAPSSISILGGSFSTGSAEEDKTYASLNFGTSHAGEDLIVQIYYSRDGNTLNNGNMVPVTVHSDGYVELTSADAYHYYPDHAEIKVYDSNSNLLTTKSVDLSPESGTQYF